MSIKKNVLYISYDGILEPIGQSQILPYILKISKKYNINIITYEKSIDLDNKIFKSKMEKKLKESKINWISLKYKKNIFSTFTNIFKGFFFSLTLSLNKKINFYHIRSYIPGLMILIFITLFNKKLIFDMRGFWIDEKVDRSTLSKNNLKYKFFKYIEKIQYNNYHS